MPVKGRSKCTASLPRFLFGPYRHDPSSALPIGIAVKIPGNTGDPITNSLDFVSGKPFPPVQYALPAITPDILWAVAPERVRGFYWIRRVAELSDTRFYPLSEREAERLEYLAKLLDWVTGDVFMAQEEPIGIFALVIPNCEVNDIPEQAALIDDIRFFTGELRDPVTKRL